MILRSPQSEHGTDVLLSQPKLSVFFFFFNVYLFIWLHWVLAAAC